MRKHKMKKIITITASCFIIVGLVAAGIIFGLYYFNQKSIDNVVNQIDERISNAEKATDSKSGGSGGSSDDDSGDSNGDDNGGNGGSYQYNNEFYYGDSNTNKPNNVDVNGLKEASIKYNEALKKTQSSKLVGEKSYSYAALDLTKFGIYDNIYGYVSAPAINMELPIYLGVTDNNMAYGAAHFCYTSLPTGGESTNVALAGHTGYIGRWLFDSIRYLKKGDDVNVKTYFGTLNYKVVSVKNKLPKESEDIFIERGKDKLTLVTCIYDSKGTYKRCIVSCERK